MPVERQILSSSQLAELIGVDPARFLGIDRIGAAQFAIVLEPEHTYGPELKTLPATQRGQSADHAVAPS